MQRTQFTFYESFFKALSRIKKKADRADAYDIICNYALYGIEPDCDSVPDSVGLAFELIRPLLDASRRKAESGKRGGASKEEGNNKQTASKEEANRKQTASKPQANRKQEKEQEQEIEQEKEQEKEQVKDKEQMLYTPAGALLPQETRKRFVPPTVAEVEAYCRERGNRVDAQAFVDHYAAANWFRGKTKISDWKACVRTWEHKDAEEPRREAAKPVKTANPFMAMLQEQGGGLG